MKNLAQVRLCFTRDHAVRAEYMLSITYWVGVHYSPTYGLALLACASSGLKFERLEKIETCALKVRETTHQTKFERPNRRWLALGNGRVQGLLLLRRVRIYSCHILRSISYDIKYE